MKKHLQFTILKSATGSPIDGLLKLLGEDVSHYHNRFGAISTWIIEFSESGIPIREIGYKRSEIAIRSPHNETHSFWGNTSLLETDLKMFFEVTEIPKNLFDENWEKFYQIVFGFETDVTKFHLVLNMDDEGDYSYMKTIIRHKGKRRILRIYFENGEGENIFHSYDFYSYPKLKVRGRLRDNGDGENLYLYESEPIE